MRSFIVALAHDEIGYVSGLGIETLRASLIMLA
jgi:hypothetical protein